MDHEVVPRPRLADTPDLHKSPVEAPYKNVQSCLLILDESKPDNQSCVRELSLQRFIG